MCKTLQHHPFVCGSWFSLPWLQELTRFQRSSPSKRQGSRNSLMTLYIIPLHLPFTLFYFLYAAWKEGLWGQGERSGATNRRTQRESECTETHSAATFRKKHPSSFYDVLKLQRAEPLRSGQPLLSVCTAVLSLSLYNLPSRKTLPFLVYVMRRFLLCAYHEDKGNGSKNAAERRGCLLFSKPSLTVRWSYLE